MTGLEITLFIIAISMLCNIVYLIAAFIKKSIEMKISGFIMLVSTPAGTIYYLGQFIMRKLSKQNREMTMEDINFSKERRNRILEPDMEKEMQSVPLEELFLVSTDAEKRKRLLTELKKEYITSYGAIKKAFDNEDPETSHYAAAAITNVKATFENDIREFDSNHRRHPDDFTLLRQYTDYVMQFLKSGILESTEALKYSYLYINLMGSVKTHSEFFSEDDYASIVNQAIFTGDLAAAEQWAKMAFETGESEPTYMNLLKVYYCTNRSEQFFQTLDLLKKSDIPLSGDGLSLIRYFIKRSI